MNELDAIINDLTHAKRRLQNKAAGARLIAHQGRGRATRETARTRHHSYTRELHAIDRQLYTAIRTRARTTQKV